METSEEITKQDILKALRKHRREFTTLINGFTRLDETEDRRLNRIVAMGLILTLFEFVDAFVNTEIDIHNFMKRRG